jgi:hypothetical protein
MAMEEDRTLFGPGPYPDAGPLAVLARVAFLAAIVALGVAVLMPPGRVPQFLYSRYLEHFAAYYVALLAGLAAMPRTRARLTTIRFVIAATALEATHLLTGSAFMPLVRNWVADVGGLSAAAAPFVVERFRRRFRPPGSAD